MRIISVKLHNVFRFGEINNVINFDDLFGNSEDDMALVTGSTDNDDNDSNGAGKSTIGEAIYWAFFEQLPRLMRNSDRKGAATGEIIRRGDDNEIPDGMKESYVELHFKTKDGRSWRLKRGRKITKSGNHVKIIELDCDGIPKGGDIEQHISDIIVSSPDSVMNSIFFAQMDTGKFLSGTDNARRNILIDLRGLSVVDKMLKILRENDKKEANKIYDSMNIKADIIKSRVDDTNDGELRKRKLEAAKSLEGVDENIKVKDGQIAELEKNECFEKARGIEGRRATLDAELDSVVNEKELALKDLRNKKEYLSGRITILKNELNGEVLREKNSLESEFSKANNTISSHSQESLESRDSSIKKAKDEMALAKLEMDDISIKFQEANDDKAKAGWSFSSSESELKTLEELRDSSKCPTCGNTWSKEEMGGRIEILSEKVSELKLDLDNKTEKAEHLKNIRDELSVRIRGYESTVSDEAALAADIERIKAANDTVKSCKQRAVGVKDREKRMNDDMEKLSTELSECTGKYKKRESEYSERESKVSALVDACREEMNNVSDAINEVNGGIRILRKEITDLQNGKIEVAAEIAKIDEKLDSRKKDLEEIADLKKNIRNQKRIIDRIEYFEKRLSGDIKNDIAESCIPLLNLYANEFLSILRDGMRVEVSSDGKNVPIRLIGSTASTYNMLSGGEQSALRLAVSMALSMISIGGAADLPDMIFLDEIFGALDSKTRENVFRLLKRLNRNFERIIVITHDSLIKEVIKTNIHIDKKDGISAISS